MTTSNDFKTRLKIAKSKIKKQVLSDNEKRGSFMGNAFKLGTELVAAVGVGTIIGFILDSWFGTKPWLIIIFFFLNQFQILQHLFFRPPQIYPVLHPRN